MKKTMCVLVTVALLIGCSRNDKGQMANEAAGNEATNTFAEQTSTLPGAGTDPKAGERMQGFKKMKEELRAKGINPDHPTNDDFRKALTGGRD